MLIRVEDVNAAMLTLVSVGIMTEAQGRLFL